jgi:Tol biopolymer transport system component/DNA-binding winged helix-turn-helix (wHTH) protein
MAVDPLARRIIRFGAFEVDLAAGELRKNGLKIRLQEQPLRVLALLLERPGEVLSRDEIREKLWSSDTFVEFEHSLNTAVNRLRAALGDSADHPRYIETLPRRGYRFIAPVDAAENQRIELGDDTSAADEPVGSQHGVQAASVARISARLPATLPVTVARRQYLPWLLFAGTAIAFLVFLYSRQTPPEAPLRKFSITPPIVMRLANMPKMVAISPDGKHIAFTEGTAEGKLWVQNLERLDAVPMEYTEDAAGPFWSPDSKFIGFATSKEIRKIAVEGGQAFRLCELPSPGHTNYSGGSWSPDGETIAFGSGGVIYELPARGGVAKQLIRSDSHMLSAEGLWGLVRSPQFLPSQAGHRLLVFAFGAYGPRPKMMVQDLDSGRQESLGPGVRPFYSPTGHLVYSPHAHSRSLMALAFSLDTLRATGEAFPIANDAHYPSIAADGTLAYLERAGREQRQLVWIDRHGNKLGELGPVRWNMRDPDLSQDGQRVAVTIAADGTSQDVWVYDTARGSGSPVTTFVDNDYCAAWAPSGEHVAFSSNRAGNPDILLRRADGTGEEEIVVSTPAYEILTDWSSDGKYLLFHRSDAQANFDIWYVERSADGNKWGEPRVFLQTPFYEGDPKLSPDGRYVAYVSDVSGEFEVYVESFPEGGGKAAISKNGGTQPRWSPDGKELFYVEGDTLLAVSVTTTPSFSVGSTTPLFRHPTLYDHTPYPQYDVSNDGQRFILAEHAGELPMPKIRVVQNWFSEFQRRQ